MKVVPAQGEQEQTFLEITEKLANLATTKHPFDADYSTVNKLKFYQDMLARVQKGEDLGKHFTGFTVEFIQEKIDGLKNYFLAAITKYDNLLLLTEIEEEIKNCDVKINETENDMTLVNNKIKKIAELIHTDPKNIGELFETYKEINNEIAKLLVTLDKLKNEKKKLEQKHRNYVDIKMTTWLINCIERFKKTDHSSKNFVDFIQTECGSFLPKNYNYTNYPFNKAPSLFPSGSASSDSEWFAHFRPCMIPGKRGGLLAMEAPQIIDHEKNDGALDAFFAFLERWNVQTIIPLGVSAARLDYKNVATKNYSMKTLDDDTLELENLTTHKKIEIKCYGFSVEDNKSLNFSNDELKRNIEIHQLSQDDIVAIHCNSGVGRTGQELLIFALLDEYVSNFVFRFACNKIINRLLSPSSIITQSVLERCVNYVLEKMSEKLHELRTTRYCLQAKEQFSHTFKQLLLLVYAKKLMESRVGKSIFELKESSTTCNEKINQLRMVLNAPYNVKKARISVCEEALLSPRTASNISESESDTKKSFYQSKKPRGKLSKEPSVTTTPSSVGRNSYLLLPLPYNQQNTVIQPLRTESSDSLYSSSSASSH